jgi:hypothetical protein
MIGIYKMIFNEQFAYIGQSRNIERRKRRHLTDMREGTHHNKHVQSCYIKFGIPEFITLEKCSVPDLDIRESYHVINEKLIVLNISPILVKNAVNFNLFANKKYSQQEVLDVLYMLANPAVEYGEICELTGVAKPTIEAIASGQQHTWLSYIEPEIYASMLKLKGTRLVGRSHTHSEEKILEVLTLLGNSKLSCPQVSKLAGVSEGIVKSILGQAAYTSLALSHPLEYANMLASKSTRRRLDPITIISPEGVEHTVTNRSAFAREFNLHKALFLQLCNGKRAQYRGWKLKESACLTVLE